MLFKHGSEFKRQRDTQTNILIKSIFLFKRIAYVCARICICMVKLNYEIKNFSIAIVCKIIKNIKLAIRGSPEGSVVVTKSLNVFIVSRKHTKIAAQVGRYGSVSLLKFNINTYYWPYKACPQIHTRNHFAGTHKSYKFLILSLSG